MEDDKDFNNIYQKLVQNYGERVEKSKKKTLNTCISATISIALFYIFWVQSNYLESHNIMIGIILAIIIFFVMRKLLIGKSRDYSLNIEVITALLKSFDSSFLYSESEKLNLKEIEKYVENEGKFTNFESKNLIKGNLKNCNIKISGIKLLNQKSEENIKTIFDGAVVILDTPKKFTEFFTIRKDTRFFDNNRKLKKIQVDLDSTEFEDVFNVYCSNQILATQLLTADVMLDLVDFFKTTKFEITIENSKIYIKLYSPKFLEKKKWKSILNKEILYKYYLQFKFAFEFTNKIIDIINQTNY